MLRRSVGGDRYQRDKGVVRSLSGPGMYLWQALALMVRSREDEVAGGEGSHMRDYAWVETKIVAHAHGARIRSRAGACAGAPALARSRQMILSYWSCREQG